MTETLRGRGPLSPAYEEALALAARVHQTQVRKGTNVPYLSHVMSVSALVLEDDGTEDEAIAAVLHDSIEDGPTWVADHIAQRFDPSVLKMVLECSDSTGGDKEPWQDRKNRYVAHLAAASQGALRVTAADKLHNLRSTWEDLHVVNSWPKSNACVHRNLWYYAAVTAAVKTIKDGSRSATALDRTLDDVCLKLDLKRPEVTAKPKPCDCPSPQ